MQLLLLNYRYEMGQLMNDLKMVSNRDLLGVRRALIKWSGEDKH